MNQEADVSQILFAPEFKILPKNFYKIPDALMEFFATRGAFLYEIFTSIAKDYNCCSFDYTPEDFSVATGCLECTKDTPHFIVSA